MSVVVHSAAVFSQALNMLEWPSLVFEIILSFSLPGSVYFAPGFHCLSPFLFCYFSLWKWWILIWRLARILLPENISPLFSTAYTFFQFLCHAFLWCIALVMPVNSLVSLYPAEVQNQKSKLNSNWSAAQKAFLLSWIATLRRSCKGFLEKIS